MNKLSGALLILIGTAGQGFGQLLVDDFSINGNLTGSMPDVGSVWTTTFGQTDRITVSGGKVAIPLSGSQIVTSSFAPQSATTVYAGFTINYESTPGGSAAGPAFLTAGGQGYAGLFVGTAEYVPNGHWPQFGIWLDDGAGLTAWPAGFERNTDYRIVLGFTENGSSDQLTIWVNPASTGSTSLAGTVRSISTSVTGFRFIETAYAGIYSADNLYVGSSFAAAAAIPEPTVGGLLVGGLFAFATRRRRV